MRRSPQPRRAAFTLVELMMVVAIIGILAGLIVPAVFAAMRAVRTGALAMESQTLAQAVEAYKNKYGDYPPDGSNASIFERHFRKAFPQILDSEFSAVNIAAGRSTGAASTTGPQVMDAAEALVFALGGFSTDKTKPFTGSGGPLTANGTSWQYNTDRDSPLFEFIQGQLTLDTSSGATLSTDDAAYYGGTNDALPAYHARGKKAPYVYFEGRTYTSKIGSGTFYNVYPPSSSSTVGYARPYRSDEVNTKVTAATNPDSYYRFVNDRTFQIIGAGLDDTFGNVYTPIYYFRYPSGESVNFSASPPSVGDMNRFLDADGMKAQHDNVANFSEGQLSDSLPN